jgi:hypothetical protein
MVIDSAGDGLYTLATHSDDPAGYYAVRTVPATDSNWHEAFLCFQLK